MVLAIPFAISADCDAGILNTNLDLIKICFSTVFETLSFELASAECLRQLHLDVLLF
jgi:hypothetical protein